MLREWLEIRKATRAAMETERNYDREIAEANRKNVSDERIRALECEASHFIDEAWAERDSAITKSLCREAGLLNVPLPDLNDPEMWHREHAYICECILTDKGISTLRKAIREEREAQSLFSKGIKALRFLLWAIAAIIGAIAALVGVLK